MLFKELYIKSYVSKFCESLVKPFVYKMPWCLGEKKQEVGTENCTFLLLIWLDCICTN